MYMAFLLASERAFLHAVSEFAYCNPFLPEHNRLEREALGDDDAASIVELARQGGFGLAECRELMDRRRNLPEKRRALARLSGLF